RRSRDPFPTRRSSELDADALDVMQETFTWLIRRAHAIELRVAMTSLLYPVVRNLSIKAAQRRRRMIGADPDDLLAPVAAPEPDTDRKSTRLNSSHVKI